MSSIPQRLYNQVMMADNFTCVYCGKRTPDVEIDHIIPRAVGGPDVLHNLVAACPVCNGRKSDHMLHEVKMNLSFGRFLRVPVKPKPPAAKTYEQKQDRVERVRELALLRNEEGWYKHSANAIVKIVRGSRTHIIAQVAEIRKGLPVNSRMRQTG